MKIYFLELDNDKILLLCDNIDTISKLLNLDIKENKYLFFHKNNLSKYTHFLNHKGYICYYDKQSQL